MNKIIKGNTDFIIVALTLASIGLTFTKIMDVKDYFSLVLAVFSYKFGKFTASQETVDRGVPKGE